MDAPDDGLIQRFQLMVFVENLPVWQETQSPVNSIARDRVFQIFETLDEFLSAENPRCMRFDSAGQTVFGQWRTTLENRLRSGDLRQDSRKAGFLAKYRSLMPSLAGLFRLVELADSPAGQAELQSDGDLFIGADCARVAVLWCGYLELQVNKLLQVASTLAPSQTLALKIQQGVVRDGMTVRDIARKQWGQLATSEAVDEALGELEDLGWLRLQEVPSGPLGGRPVRQICLHPEVLSVLSVDSAKVNYHFDSFTEVQPRYDNQQQAPMKRNLSTQCPESPLCVLHAGKSTDKTDKTSLAEDTDTKVRL